MNRVVLISCTKSKRTNPCKARLLYDVSSKFRKSLAYAKLISDNNIYVISAKHGLVDMDMTIAPYDETLVSKSQVHKEAWGENVFAQIASKFDIKNTQFVILAGRNYYTPLQKFLPNIELPLYGLRQGESLAKLNELIGNASKDQQ